MALVNCKEMVLSAQKGGYSVPALNSNGGNYDILRACLETAAEMRSPLIINVYGKNGRYAGLKYVAHSARFLIEQFAPEIPVAIHLDHGENMEEWEEAIQAGFTSIMCDGSMLPLEENIALTRKAVAVAQAAGVTVEAELGQLLHGESDPDNPGTVQVEEVKRFVTGVNVDMLAIGIGNSHGEYQGDPNINVKRLKEVRAITDIPLVLHGATGIPERTVKECIACGMAKINFGTMLRANYIKYFGEACQDDAHGGQPWRCMEHSKNKLKEDVRWILSLIGSEGKAG